MADEPITEPVVEQEPKVSPAQERITQLSDKVRTEAEARKAAEDRAAAAEKKAAFAEQYADVVVSNPAAKEFKADIEAKVMSGYTVEDATYAVLGKAGKLGNTGASQPIQSPAGGSAPNTITTAATKTPAEMSQEERRKELAENLMWT